MTVDRGHKSDGVRFKKGYAELLRHLASEL